MASLFDDSMSGNFQCSVCSELLSDPKELPCSHILCKKCLSANRPRSSQTTANSLSCPICQSITDIIGGNNVDILKIDSPSDSHINDVNSKQFSGQCHANSRAVHSYRGCGDYVCRACLENHVEMEPSLRVLGAEDVRYRKLVKEKVIDCPQMTLDKQLETGKVKLFHSLDDMRDADDELVEDASCLADNTSKARLNNDARNRDSLSGDLRKVQGRENPKKKPAIYVADRAEKKIILPNNHRHPLQLKQCDMATIIWIFVLTLTLSAAYYYSRPMNWVMKCDVELPKAMSAIAPTLDDDIAVGYYSGSIDMANSEGQRKLLMQKQQGVTIYAFGFLSDGSCAVVDSSNILMVFVRRDDGWINRDVSFETLSEEKGGLVSLSVDSNDLIYVSYRKAMMFLVYSPLGGKAIREIPCNGYVPMQITTYHDKDYQKTLLIFADELTVIISDTNGNELHKRDTPTDNDKKKSGVYAFAGVTQRNIILIAWVDHNNWTVRIDEYTHELKHVKNLIYDHKIPKHKTRWWYFIREFKTGEIAFCTTDKLYIFKQ